MKSKEIEIEINATVANSNSYVWVRPNAKFKSAMDTRGGFAEQEQFPFAFSLFKYGGAAGNSCFYIMTSGMTNTKPLAGVFSYCFSGNLSFFKQDPTFFNDQFFDTTGFSIMYLRKYTKEQKKWLLPILRLFKGRKFVVGEYYPAIPVGNVVNIYLSDTYCYFKIDGVEKELDPQVKITTKSFKDKKDSKLTKSDILKALDHVAAVISEREVTDREFKQKDAKGKCVTAKRYVKSYADSLAKARIKEVAFAKAEQAAKAILTPEELRHIKAIHSESAKDSQEIRVSLEKQTFEYKRYLSLAKSPTPKKEDYILPEEQMIREFTKIRRFLDEGVIEKFDYDPSKGIIITFPPMVYKSFRGSRYNCVFLGRPRVIIHDPSTCSLGKGSCGIIRFTLPSYETGYGCTDHFDNTNGPKFDKCVGSPSISRNGQCLGTSSSDSYLNIFMPLIASRRFGELIPHLKRYILESNGESPLMTPKENMLFTSIEPGGVHPTHLTDDSWTEYVKATIKSEEAKKVKA